MLIPDEAVVNDQTRQVAYVVGPDDIVAQRTIEVGRLVDGMRVVRSGPRSRLTRSSSAACSEPAPDRKVNPQPDEQMERAPNVAVPPARALR